MRKFVAPTILLAVLTNFGCQTPGTPTPTVTVTVTATPSGGKSSPVGTTSATPSDPNSASTSATPAVASTGTPASPINPTSPATPTSGSASNPPEVKVPVDSAKMEHIRIQAVTYESMPSAEITAPGKLETNPDLVSHIYLPVGGRVLQVLVKEGDPVQKGQTLVSVLSPDATEAQANLRERQAAVREAQDSLIEANVALTKARTSQRKAELDYRRVKDLFSHDAIAKKELLVAETDLAQTKSDVINSQALIDQAKAGIQSAEAARDQAQSRLEIMGISANDPHPQIAVPSPLSGKVLETKIVAGEYRSDLAAAVMTIADLSSLWVVSNVPESEIDWIQIGEPVHISLDAYPGQKFEGRVKRIADVLDPKTRTIKVMTELRNPMGKFRPEMFGRIHHEHQSRRSVVVPATAVVEKGNGEKLVYIEKAPGTFVARTVQIGQRRDDQVAITKGLSPGQKVVVEGALLLKKTP